ncbi:hypothetical protein PVK06_047573 [Gossypium arboreum]|uniref:Uncharacterized protein n=1 Tax=Gossypium arboreum TaxID=29729 RepID=A0ABR0MDZ4_GOSAR|nr:hypothetical protein PVK06_047573 [Gossypium arboreum]
MNNINTDNTPINILSSRNTNIANPSITISRATFTIFGASTGVASASTVVAFKTTYKGYVTKEEPQRLLDEKNKSLSIYEFDLKLPYPAKVVTNPILKTTQV